MLKIVLGDWLEELNPVLRTFVLATSAVPIVIYGLMPQLHKAGLRFLHHRAGGRIANPLTYNPSNHPPCLAYRA